MFTSADQLVALHKATLDTLQAVALKSVEGYEKLAELQMQAAKTSMEEGALQWKALFESRDPKGFADVALASAQPAADKVSAYARHVYEIATETNTEIAKIVERHIAESNKQLLSAIDSLGKNAPAGTEGLVTFVKSAVSNANSAWDQVNKATKQVVELTEANLAAATKNTVNAANRTARKAA
ncbi:MAG TPA: TIGR01841 family phasin [Burkholderiaceae bacterium]|jgi:phasin family protein|nr:TIGR01841 family phasin [Burkholderiaceae bacterium]